MKKRALVIIDIQNEYFPGGAFPLSGPEAAAQEARCALEAARQAGLVVIHVRHENADDASPRFRAGSEGAAIHRLVSPLEGEAIVTKRRVDSFAGTGLEGLLRSSGVEEIAVAGMMTHMCVDAFLRAATARDYQCVLLADATATRDLEWASRAVAAADVEAAFCAAFSFFGVAVTSAAEWARGLAE